MMLPPIIIDIKLDILLLEIISFKSQLQLTII